MKVADGCSAEGEVACEHDVVGVRDRDAGMEEVRSYTSFAFMSSRSVQHSETAGSPDDRESWCPALTELAQSWQQLSLRVAKTCAYALSSAALVPWQDPGVTVSTIQITITPCVLATVPLVSQAFLL